MMLLNGEIIFDCNDNRCEFCGTTFELRYYQNRLLCTECAKAEKEKWIPLVQVRHIDTEIEG